MTKNRLEIMQLWVDALLGARQLNTEIRHRLLWDVVYCRMVN